MKSSRFFHFPQHRLSGGIAGTCHRIADLGERHPAGGDQDAALDCPSCWAPYCWGPPRARFWARPSASWWSSWPLRAETRSRSPFCQTIPPSPCYCASSKGRRQGPLPGLLFKLVRRKNEYAAVFAAALSAPVVNTGLFILGALLMSDTIGANFVADGTTVLYFLVIGCAGLNFVVEFIVNAVASPAIYTVERLIERRVLKGEKGRPETGRRRAERYARAERHARRR